jgi:hypothetical protein
MSGSTRVETSLVTSGAMPLRTSVLVFSKLQASSAKALL